ncbi:hypothetical protein C1646_666995 [Rhizophagus diaphanus]|nr:hypothetical protein C1646_666995 [Rhizophagus diaphanus] [Rhizophagus sp. MUCL 43196]
MLKVLIEIGSMSDLGFCEPADKPLERYMEILHRTKVIVGKGYTKASDIYSVAILLWEISSEQSPFVNYNDDYSLAMDIVSGMKPKILSGTSSKYKELMEQCWDADPTKRPDIYIIRYKIREINRLILPKPYHSKPYNFNIPEDRKSKALSKVFQKLRLGSGDNNQGKEIAKQQNKETRCRWYIMKKIFNNEKVTLFNYGTIKFDLQIVIFINASDITS